MPQPNGLGKEKLHKCFFFFTNLRRFLGVEVDLEIKHYIC